MAGYTKLFSKILNSSIWSEDNETRILWVTMLAMCDQHGFVEAAPNALAHQARISMDEFTASIEKLQSPDEYSSSSEYEGRRVSKCEGGWVVLNYEKYRGKLLNSKENEQARDRMRKHRAKLAGEESEQSVTLRNPASASPSSFDVFWEAYPRKTGKMAAEKAWKKHNPDIDKCLTALEWQKKDVQWQDKAYIPHPATWLNRGSWDDEDGGGKTQEEIDLIARRKVI